MMACVCVCVIAINFSGFWWLIDSIVVAISFWFAIFCIFQWITHTCERIVALKYRPIRH